MVALLKTWNVGSWPVRMVFLVLMLCTVEFVGKVSWLLTVKFINGYILIWRR